MRGHRRERRRVLRLLGGAAAGTAAWCLRAGAPAAGPPTATLFLCGDVMTGRAIDQILPHPSDPVLYEPSMRSARGYLALAERAHGRLPRAVPPAYVWGGALPELARRRPAARIVNLETSVTRSATPWPKTVNYRMHPDNIACLGVAGIDCCALANNHVLDWGHAGLAETLATLRRARIAGAGAGADLDEAQAPAALPLPGGARLLVFAAATGDSGVPPEWAATAGRAGVHRLPDLSARTMAGLAALVRRHRRPGDRVLWSLHWGGNWGYSVPAEQRDFAHALVDEAGADIVHGHSSHHPKAIEVHHDRPILYGCGDFLDDYEGIAGHDEFRGELGLMLFPTIDLASGRLRGLDLVPTRIRRFRVGLAPRRDRAWLLARLRRECRPFGCDLVTAGRGFAVHWA